MSRIVGHYWDEHLEGGDFNDQIYAKGGDDYVDGGWGNDRIYGDTGNDTLYGHEGRDRVGGGSGDDVIWDGEGDYNLLDGGRGKDWIGGIGDLYGRDGDDNLSSSQGGGLQGTRLTGGNGHDTFSIALDAASGATYDWYDGHLTGLGPRQHITVTDFRPGTDGLYVSAADPLGNWFGGNPTDVLSVFDDNYDNKLTKDDTHVDATADGKGIELDFWNVELKFINVQVLTQQDFVL